MGTKQNFSWLFKPPSEVCYPSVFLEDPDKLWEVVRSLVVAVTLEFQHPCWKWAAPRPTWSSSPSSQAYMPSRVRVPVVIVVICLQSIEKKCRLLPRPYLEWKWLCLKFYWVPHLSAPGKQVVLLWSWKEQGKGHSTGGMNTQNSARHFQVFLPVD